MSAEARIAAEVDRMLRSIVVPPAPLAKIRQEIAQAQPAPASASRFYLPAAVAAAAVAVWVFALPAVAPGLTQSVESRIEAILHWKPPPPPPKSVASALRWEIGSLAAVRSRVSFTIVPPAGLPRDVVSQNIATTPTGVYSRITHRWSVGSPVVSFTYRRANGRTFTLTARRFDAREGPPSTYVFEDMDRTRNGREVIVRREQFTWRNRDQLMNAITGEGITASEIAKIRNTMRGIAVHGTWPPQEGSIDKQYLVP